MPRFAANLAYLFTERPMLERFAAAHAAGFADLPHFSRTCRRMLGYTPSSDVLGSLGINTAHGQHTAGGSGVAAIPGREPERRRSFVRRSTMSAIGGCQILLLAGTVPPSLRPAAERTFIANLFAPQTPRANATSRSGRAANPRDRPDISSRSSRQPTSSLRSSGRTWAFSSTSSPRSSAAISSSAEKYFPCRPRADRCRALAR
jgi:hydroxypyruvate isomerase